MGRHVRVGLVLALGVVLIASSCKRTEDAAQKDDPDPTAQSSGATPDDEAGDESAEGTMVDDEASGESDEAPMPTDDTRAPAMTAFAANKGFYEMAFEPDAGWHQHAISIDDVAPGHIRGRVVVDQGIGPQGRAPKPDEKQFLLAWQAEPDDDPRRLRFAVGVGDFQPTRYAFDLFLCEGDAMTRCEAVDGHDVTLQGTVRTGEADPRKVVATPMPEPEPAWDGWESLPRGDEGVEQPDPDSAPAAIDQPDELVPESDD